MRILAIQSVLQGYTINPVAGGRNKAFLRLAEYLVDHGHEVFVFPWLERLLEPFPFRLNEGSGYATSLPTVSGFSFRRAARRLPKLFSNGDRPRQLGKRVKRWLDDVHDDRDHAFTKAMAAAKPDVVHVHHTVSEFPKVYRRLSFAEPLILTHTHGEGTALELYDQIVFHSAYQREIICRKYPTLERVSRVIYCPVDDEYRIAPTQLSGGGLVFLGNLHADERKGVDILLRAYLEESTLNQWRLTIIGEGAMRAHYERMVAERKLNVHFAGRLSNAECARRMREADIFIMPSREEGWGMVYAEALCTGLPIIGYPPSVEELSRLLGTRPGLSFDASKADHHGLAATIKEMMAPANRLDLRQRQDLAQRAGRLFSSTHFGAEHMRCFQDTIVALSK